jgi:histone-lysine N-methyltransferase SETMAR
MENRSVTIDELQLATSPCHATIHAIVRKDLKMKVCAHWVLSNLMPEQKKRRVQNCQELLALHNKDPERLFARMVTGESAHPKKFWTAPSARKQMASVFLNMEGNPLIEWLPQGQTINRQMYYNTLTCLCRRIQLWRQGKWARQVLLLLDNARQHSSTQTTQQLVSLGYTVLPHPPYSPDLAPSDYALFNKMKEPFHRRKLPTSDVLERGVCTLCAVSPNTGMLPLSESYQREENGA